MVYSRTKNSIRNVIFGIVSMAVNILFPFMVRTVLIKKMGLEYAGISTLFSSVLSMLKLSELGIGSAMIYSLYEPIAREDHEKINNILNSYRKLYRAIGAFILTAGLIVTPFIKYLIKDDVPPDVNVYIVFVIFLADTALSYFLFAYKDSVLSAFQRMDLKYVAVITMNIVVSVLQAAAIWFTSSYYIYALCLPAGTIFLNLMRRYIADKNFPAYSKPYGKVDSEFYANLKKRVIALFGHQTNYTIIHSADDIVLSAFMGIKTVGLYGNYYMLFSGMENIIRIITMGVQAGVGNSLVVDSEEKIYKDFKNFAYMVAFSVGIISTVFLCACQDTVELWLGRKKMLGESTVILLAVALLVTQMRRVVVTYKNAAGMWWEDRYKPYVVAVVDLLIDIVFVQKYGVNAVVVSTIVSVFFIETPWEAWVLFKLKFHKNPFEYFFRMMVYFMVIAVVGAFSYFVCSFVSGPLLFKIIAKAFIGVIIPCSIYVLISFKSDEFKALWKIAGRIMNKLKKNG